MTPAEILFWLSLAVLFYTYAGYGAILYFWNKLKQFMLPRVKRLDFELLPVTMVVAAYNEEAILQQKICNTLEIDYPSHLLQVIFITDGSTDRSPDVVSRYDFITLLHQNNRKGKSAALKRAMRFVKTPVVVFSDANSLLNQGCIKAIVRHYADEKVGGVAGEKRIIATSSNSFLGQTEGLYWKYESFMKQQDSDFNTVVGAAGELFSIRTELFPSFEDELILDDFIISMQVCLDGFKIKYEPEAYAVETPSASLADEEKRRVRIASGAYQSIDYSNQSPGILKYPLLAVQYFSRRFLKWIACPVFIVLLFFSNIWLVAHQQEAIFTAFFLIQLIFYSLAFAGALFAAKGRRIAVLNIPFYFMFMNLCLVKGFINYLQGRQTVLWERSIREAIK